MCISLTLWCRSFSEATQTDFDRQVSGQIQCDFSKKAGSESTRKMELLFREWVKSVLTDTVAEILFL